MKNLLLGLLIALSFTACKKNEEAPPDAGATVAGTYPMTLIGTDDGTGYEELNLPIATTSYSASGVITSVRTDANNVNLSATLTEVVSGTTSTSTFPPAPLTTLPVALQKNGTSYDMLYNGTKIGTADGTNIAIDISQPASGTTPAQRVAFKGKK